MSSLFNKYKLGAGAVGSVAMRLAVNSKLKKLNAMLRYLESSEDPTERAKIPRLQSDIANVKAKAMVSGFTTGHAVASTYESLRGRDLGSKRQGEFDLDNYSVFATVGLMAGARLAAEPIKRAVSKKIDKRNNRKIKEALEKSRTRRI